MVETKKNGIPTGGSLCVQLANIAVYYVMSQKVYNVPHMMINVSDVMRFIDDGTGLYYGTEEEFFEWLRMVNIEIGMFGLHIDEASFKKNSEFINFLDIKYCFDSEGELQTDLFVKETDSRSYLNFSSAHENHTFSGNVYSQSLRLRRIINSKERLSTRLNELADCFKKAGYPETMVKNITTKVLNSDRDISIKENKENSSDDLIRVISTYKTDDNMIKAVKRSEESLKLTKSFRNQRGPLFTYVKKVGPNIRCYVNNLKQQALGIKRGAAAKCNARGCKTCQMLSLSPRETVGGRVVKLSQGSCKSYNLCYLAICDLCKKPYTGRTIQMLCKRINGHRELFRYILRKVASNEPLDIDTTSDLYMLGLHLYLDHGITDVNAFDNLFKFGILEVVTPTDIDRKEFRWMHKLNTFQPHGLNVEYPFGIPYLERN